MIETMSFVFDQTVNIISFKSVFLSNWIFSLFKFWFFIMHFFFSKMAYGYELKYVLINLWTFYLFKAIFWNWIFSLSKFECFITLFFKNGLWLWAYFCSNCDTPFVQKRLFVSNWVFSPSFFDFPKKFFPNGLWLWIDFCLISCGHLFV